MQDYSKKEVPIVRAIHEYVAKRRDRFHTPGHKGKPIAKPLAGVYRYDVTELPGLDSLHQPDGAIQKAQKLLAQLYGAKESHFLVNGSSSGVIAMMLTVLNPGDKVLVGRDAHFSVMSGLVMTGAVPVYIPVYIHRQTGTPLGVKTSDVLQAIDDHPDAKAVLLVRPGYHGTCFDLVPVVKKAKASGVVVLVDEAHGAHLAFDKGIPDDAISSGADMCCQSPHKTLGGLTQTGWLHVNSNRIDSGRLALALRIVQSTSPSYILMASMDTARRDMALKGRFVVNRAVKLSKLIQDKVNAALGPVIMDFSASGQWEQDPVKLTLNAGVFGVSGNYIGYVLQKVYNIEPEYSDENKVLFLITPYDSRQKAIRLVQAITGLSRTLKCKIRFQPDEPPKKVYLPPRPLLPKDAFFAPAEIVLAKEAVGRLCAEPIVPYPPGIPFVYPGEVITPSVLGGLGQKQHIRVIAKGWSDLS